MLHRDFPDSLYAIPYLALRSHGEFWLQSLPFSRLADRVLASAPRAGGKQVGAGSVLGRFGDMFGDR